MTIPKIATAAATALLLWACIPGMDGGTSPPTAPGDFASSDHATVEVENSGLASQAIYSSEMSARLGTVMPGQVECVEIPRTSGDLQLIARPVGGGEATVSPTFSPDGGDGWSWSLGNNPRLDRISLSRSDHCG